MILPIMQDLIKKYNVAGPRYTSYPTVPYWDDESFSYNRWQSIIQSSTEKNGPVSLYIHLPFCESLCTFCACNKRITKRHTVELPYIKALLKELDLYTLLYGHKLTIKDIHLGGGTPTFFSPDHLEKLLKGIFERAFISDDASFSFEGHPNNTSVEHLKILHEYYFDRVSYGIQDYNPEVQRAINRKQTFENVKYVTQTARDIGYKSVGHDLIYGLPFQTVEHILNTIKKTISLRPDRIAFYSYAHTPWIKGNGQRGFKDSDLPDAKTKRLQYELGKAMLEESGYHEIGMDHFALPNDELYVALEDKSLHRNFMGYTTQHTTHLIGLGVSSISDAWFGFAQNEKNLEDYYQSIRNNKIPVFRGHILSSEDLEIRRHILNLMTRFETDLTETKLNPIALNTIYEHLETFINDGLVVIESSKIIVKPKAKAFIRNICMAFDLRMLRKKPQTQLFSMTI
jgi:oxygen-independent coproporphyrinogen-3 oxidase